MPSARTELHSVPWWDKTRWHQKRFRWRDCRNRGGFLVGRWDIHGVEVVGGWCWQISPPEMIPAGCQIRTSSAKQTFVSCVEVVQSEFSAKLKRRLRPHQPPFQGGLLCSGRNRIIAVSKYHLPAVVMLKMRFCSMKPSKNG